MAPSDSCDREVSDCSTWTDAVAEVSPELLPEKLPPEFSPEIRAAQVQLQISQANINTHAAFAGHVVENKLFTHKVNAPAEV